MGVFARVPIVAPRTERLDLGDGHWIEVKRQLNYGEMADVAEATKGSLLRSQVQLLAAYITDWSLVDDQGQALPVETLDDRIRSLRAMESEAVNAIDAVITKHAEGVQSAKKSEAPSGRPRSKKTSPSLAHSA